MAMERLLSGRSGENTRVHRGSSTLKELAKNTLSESKPLKAPDASAYSAALESAHHMAGARTAENPRSRSIPSTTRTNPPGRESDFQDGVEECPSDDLLFDALTSINTDPEPISQPSSSAVKAQGYDGSTVVLSPGLANEVDSIDENPSDELLFHALADIVSSPPIAAPPPPVSRSSEAPLKATISNREHDIVGQYCPVAIVGKRNAIQVLEFPGFSAQPKFARLQLGAVLRRKRCGLVVLPLSEGQQKDIRYSPSGLHLPVGWSKGEPAVPALNLAFEHNLAAPLAGSVVLSFPIFGRAGIVAGSGTNKQFQSWQKSAEALLALQFSIESDLKMPPPPVSGSVDNSIVLAARSLKAHQLQPASEEAAIPSSKLLVFNGSLQSQLGLQFAEAAEVPLIVEARMASSEGQTPAPLTWPLQQSRVLLPTSKIDSDLKMPPPPLSGLLERSHFIASRSLQQHQPQLASEEWTAPASRLLAFNGHPSGPTGLQLVGSKDIQFDPRLTSASSDVLVSDPLPWGSLQPSILLQRAMIESDLKMPPPPIAGPRESSIFIAARNLEANQPKLASEEWAIPCPRLVAFNDSLDLDTGFALSESGSILFEFAIAQPSVGLQTTHPLAWGLPQPRFRPLHAVVESDLEMPPPPVSGLVEQVTFIASRSLQKHQPQPASQQWTDPQPILLAFNNNLELHAGFAIAEETDSSLFDLSFVKTNGEAPVTSQLQWPIQQPRVRSVRAVIESDLEIPPPPVSGFADWTAVIASRRLLGQQTQASAQQWTIPPPVFPAINNNLELHTGFGLAAESENILFDLSFVEPVLVVPAGNPLPWTLPQPILRQLPKLAEDELVESVLDAPPFAGLVENIFLPSIQKGKELHYGIEQCEPTHPTQNFFKLSPAIESSVGPDLVEQQFTLALSQAKPAHGNSLQAELHEWLSTLESFPRFAVGIKRYRTVPTLALAGLDDCEPFLQFKVRDSRKEEPDGAMRFYFMRPAICPPDLLGIGSKSLYVQKINGLVASKTTLCLDLTGDAIPLRAFASNLSVPISIEASSLPVRLVALAFEPELDWESIQQSVKQEAIPPFADLVSLPVVNKVKYSRAKANTTSIGLVQMLVEGKKPVSGLSVEPLAFNEKSAEKSLRSSLEQKKHSAGFSLFWLKAPADLKWIMLSLPVIIGVWLYTSAGTTKKPVAPAEAPIPVVETVNSVEPAYDAYTKPGTTVSSEQAEPAKEEAPLRATPPQVAIGGQMPDQADSWDKFKQRVAFRAAIAHEEDFHSGLSQWGGRKGWANTWSYDRTGLVRVGQLALFSPSMSMIDYHFEVTASLDRQSMGWVFRSLDLNNYYAGRLVITRPGPVPTVSLERYAVIGGRKMKSQFIPVPITHRGDTIFTISVDVAGNSFTTSVQGQIVDSFTDDKFKFGGIGLFSGRGEESRVFRVSLTHNNDTFGRLCALIAPYETISSGSVKK